MGVPTNHYIIIYTYVSEPPIIKDVSDDELRHYIDHPLIINLPSNTQFVERMIQTVSKLGTVAADARQRDGFAKATFENQKLMPTRRTKSDFARFT